CQIRRAKNSTGRSFARAADSRTRQIDFCASLVFAVLSSALAEANDKIKIKMHPVVRNMIRPRCGVSSLNDESDAKVRGDGMAAAVTQTAKEPSLARAQAAAVIEGNRVFRLGEKQPAFGQHAGQRNANGGD